MSEAESGEHQVSEGRVPFSPPDDAPLHAQTAASLNRMARHLFEVRGELSALLDLTPLASSRLVRDLGIAGCLADIETLEIRLATLSVGLRYASSREREPVLPGFTPTS